MRRVTKLYEKVRSVIYCVLGALAACVPAFTVCPWTPEKGYMICWETAKGMMGIGSVLFFAGILLLFVRKPILKILLHGVSLVSETVGILLPLTIFGGCRDLGMSCHTTAYPFIYVIMTISIIISVYGIIASILTYKSAERKHMAVLVNQVK